MAEELSIGKMKVNKRAVTIAAIMGGGILAYAYFRQPAGGTAEPATTGLDPSIDPYTGIPYADQYGGISGYGGAQFGSIYDPYTGQQIGTGVGNQIVTGVSTNAAWAQASTAYLQSIGYEGALVAAAIGKGLGGQPMSDTEMSIFRAAIAFQGSPPQGYPPLIAIPPGTGGNTGNTPLTAPKNLKVKSITRTTASLDWDPVPGAQGYTVYKNGGRYQSVVFSNASVGGLAPGGKTYKFNVRAIANGKEGPSSATVSGRTKK